MLFAACIYNSSQPRSSPVCPGALPRGLAAGGRAAQDALGQGRVADNAHPEYPRPADGAQGLAEPERALGLRHHRARTPSPPSFDAQILVPFPVESALSGVMKRVSETDRLWYRRTFEVPEGWRGRRVLLHFGAVDFETHGLGQRHEVGQHRGGYDAFTFRHHRRAEPVRRATSWS